MARGLLLWLLGIPIPGPHRPLLVPCRLTSSVQRNQQGLGVVF